MDKIKKLPDHYLNKVGKSHLENCRTEEVYHELTGGSFKYPIPVTMFTVPPTIKYILDDFTDVPLLVLRTFNN